MFRGSEELLLEISDGEGDAPILAISGALPRSTHGASHEGILKST